MGRLGARISRQLKNIKSSIRDMSQKTAPVHNRVAKIAKVMTKAGQRGRLGCALSAVTAGASPGGLTR
jgi:hypothetical protein